MQHLDEGTIHALLDGELAGVEGTEVLQHIESCETCSSRVAEERMIQAEAERMILELDAPAPAAAAAAAGMPFTTDEPFVLAPPPTDQLVRQGPPVVLVPNRDTDRPRIPLRYLATAAMLVVAAGAGYLASTARRGGPVASQPEVYTDAPVTITVPPIAVMDSAVDSTSPAAGAAAAAAAPEVVAVDSPVVRDTPARERLVRSPVLRDSAPTISLSESQSAKAADRQSTRATPPPTPPVRRDQDEAGRIQSQRAERPLDPETRAREEAAIREAEGTPTAAVAAPQPAPVVAQPQARSLDQEAQITMRVGLDEAQRLLGGPVHVIDGMRPEFMGLVEGRLVPGADANSYVVRVVYLDDNRRLLFLDQQRLDQSRRLTGAARDTTPPDWVKGDVRLSLKGSLSPAQLRSVAARVR